MDYVIELLRPYSDFGVLVVAVIFLIYTVIMLWKDIREQRVDFREHHEKCILTVENNTNAINNLIEAVKDLKESLR